MRDLLGRFRALVMSRASFALLGLMDQRLHRPRRAGTSGFLFAQMTRAQEPAMRRLARHWLREDMIYRRVSHSDQAIELHNHGLCDDGCMCRRQKEE